MNEGKLFMLVATVTAFTAMPLLLGLLVFINPPHLPEYYQTYGLLKTLVYAYFNGLIPVLTVSPMLILGWTIFSEED